MDSSAIELTQILNSRAFYNILDEHKKSLQEEVNKFVREKDLTGAFGALRALDDSGRIVKLMKLKLAELKK